MVTEPHFKVSVTYKTQENATIPTGSSVNSVAI